MRKTISIDKVRVGDRVVGVMTRNVYTVHALIDVACGNRNLDRIVLVNYRGATVVYTTEQFEHHFKKEQRARKT